MTLLLLIACSPFGHSFELDIEPGTAGVIIPLHTVVWIPEDASDEPVTGTLRIDAEPRNLEAYDRFDEVFSLTVNRLVHLELDRDEPFDAPIWVGRWDDERARKGLEGTLYTVDQRDDGWLASAYVPQPWVEMDPVLVHPDRAWFATDQPISTHGTAARP